jgi:hypothetical protein
MRHGGATGVRTITLSARARSLDIARAAGASAQSGSLTISRPIDSGSCAITANAASSSAAASSAPMIASMIRLSAPRICRSSAYDLVELEGRQQDREHDRAH